MQWPLPTTDVPTCEPEHLAKVKTGVPEQTVAKRWWAWEVNGAWDQIDRVDGQGGQVGRRISAAVDVKRIEEATARVSAHSVPIASDRSHSDPSRHGA